MYSYHPKLGGTPPCLSRMIEGGCADGCTYCRGKYSMAPVWIKDNNEDTTTNFFMRAGIIPGKAVDYAHRLYVNGVHTDRELQYKIYTGDATINDIVRKFNTGDRAKIYNGLARLPDY